MGGRKQKFKAPQTGIYVIGEGKTEKFYFTHLRKIFGFKCTVHPRFCRNTSVSDIAGKIKSLLSGDITIFVVFDADVSLRNPKERKSLSELRKEYQLVSNVVFCDSLPSIEYWFLIHYKDTQRAFNNSREAERELKKFIPNYIKTESFLKNEKWVSDMSKNHGDLWEAVDRAKSYGQEGASYTNIYLAIKALSHHK